MDEKRTRRRLTKEFKVEAIQSVKRRDGKEKEVATDLGRQPVLLHRWIRAYSDDSEYALKLLLHE